MLCALRHALCVRHRHQALKNTFNFAPQPDTNSETFNYPLKLWKLLWITDRMSDLIYIGPQMAAIWAFRQTQAVIRYIKEGLYF